MTRRKVTFTRKAEGPGGRGFERTRHTAYVDGHEIGSWAGSDALCTVGLDNRSFLPYRDWLARVRKYADTPAAVPQIDDRFSTLNFDDAEVTIVVKHASGTISVGVDGRSGSLVVRQRLRTAVDSPSSRVAHTIIERSSLVLTVEGAVTGDVAFAPLDRPIP